jgi:hypothetical protein
MSVIPRELYEAPLDVPLPPWLTTLLLLPLPSVQTSLIPSQIIMILLLLLVNA